MSINSPASSNSHGTTTVTTSDTQSALKRLLHPHCSETIQLMGQSPLLADVLDHTEGSSNWQISPESRVIKAHFPDEAKEEPEGKSCQIVPLVTMMALHVLAHKKLSFQCVVHGPTLPGDTIGISNNGIHLEKAGVRGADLVTFTDLITHNDTQIGKNIRPTEIPMTRVETDVLPHGHDFRFVTHAKTDTDVTHFEGGYYVSNGHLIQKGLFDAALLPEVVAQIGAVVGATIIPKGHIFVYKGGILISQKTRQL